MYQKCLYLSFIFVNNKIHVYFQFIAEVAISIFDEPSENPLKIPILYLLRAQGELPKYLFA
jgi:hypothetical protein